jgi:hypothetical protein
VSVNGCGPGNADRGWEWARLKCLGCVVLFEAACPARQRELCEEVRILEHQRVQTLRVAGEAVPHRVFGIAKSEPEAVPAPAFAGRMESLIDHIFERFTVLTFGLGKRLTLRLGHLLPLQAVVLLG